MAADNSTESDSMPSLLLTLPMELLQRIIIMLGDETLPTFRLTCKTIEATTFDLFAQIFFEERYCCIFYKPRWTLLEDVISSRMGDRVRRVVFTTDVLAPFGLEHLQIAPTKPSGKISHIAYSQCEVRRALIETVGPRTQIPAWPSRRVIERCLIFMRNLTPNVLVEAHFGSPLSFGMEEECDLVTVNVLAAVFDIRMKLTALEISSDNIIAVNEAMKALGHDLTSRLRSLQSFSFMEPYAADMDARRVVYGFLESMTELRDLRFQFSHTDYAVETLPGPTNSELLSIARVTKLTSLDLSMLTLRGAELVAVLSCCNSTLLKVTMSFVCISGRDSVWADVFDELVSMPRLSKVYLRWLQYTRYEIMKGCRYVTVSRTWTANEGRAKLASRLADLLATMPSVVN